MMRSTRTFAALASALLTGALLPGAALAQMMMNTSTLDLGIMQSQQNSFLFQSINSANATSDAATGRTGQSSRTTTPPPGRPGVTWGATATRFRSVAPSLMPAQLAAELGRDAKHRAALEHYFGATLQDYRDIVRQRGAPSNDVARAASFVVATCYDVLHGENSFDETAMNALRAQLARALPQDAKFQTYDDRRKQEAYERFAILGMHLGGMRLKAEQTKDEALMRTARRMASQQLQDMFGVPARRIKIDRNGLSF
jgi:hypothetical protein